MLVSCQLGFPHVGTPCLIPECPSKAHLSLMLWQPDICPHDICCHMNRWQPFIPWNDQSSSWGLWNWCSLVKMGLRTKDLSLLLYSTVCTLPKPQGLPLPAPALTSRRKIWCDTESGDSNCTVGWVTLKALSLGSYSAQERHLLSELLVPSSAAPFSHVLSPWQVHGPT